MTSLFQNLQVIPGIPLETDEIYSDAELYNKLKELQHDTSEVEAEIQRRRRLKSASKGLAIPYIDIDDLVIIIEDLLSKKSTVSKAFQRREVSGGKFTGWATRAIKYYVEPVKLRQAIGRLLNNRNNISLKLMDKYKVLDIERIVSSRYYPEAWKKIMKLLDIALRFKAKDDQLAVKDQTIADKDNEIKRLQTELLRNNSKDWKHEAIKQKKLGVSVAEIARLLSKGRTTISNYLNEPGIKLLWCP